MGFTRNRKSTDDTPAKGGKGDRKPSIRDLLGMIEWPSKAKFLTGRMFPGVVPVGVHKYPLFKKDGEAVRSDKFKDKVTGLGKQVEIDKVCLAFDMDTTERDPDKECPYCAAELYFKIEYYGEFIIGEEKETEPAKHRPSADEKKSGLKDKDNDGSWTPVRVNKMSSNTYKKLKNLKQLNKVKIEGEKVPVAVDDEENGCEINMNFDGDATGDGMYGMQKGDHAPLTDEDKEFLRWDIEGAVEASMETLDEAQRNADWFSKHSKGGNAAADDEPYAPEKGDMVVIEDEDDERHEGKVVSNSDTKVVIEDEDGDAKTFRWSKVNKCTPLKSKAKGKAAKDEDDNDDDAPAPKGKAKKTYKPEEGDYVVVTDEDDDTFEGKVIEIDAKTITIEVDDAEKIFKLVKVTVTEGEKPKPAGKKKVTEPEPTDEYEPEKGDTVSVDDGDDTVVGNVTDVDAKSITIEDEDGEDHTFKRAKVTVTKAKAKPAKKAAKVDPEPEPEDDDYTPEEGDMVVVTDADDDELVTGKVMAVDSKSITVENDDGDEKTFKLAKVTVKEAPKKKAAKTKTKPAADEDDDAPPPKKKAKPVDDDDDAPPPRAKQGKRSFNFDE